MMPILPRIPILIFLALAAVPATVFAEDDQAALEAWQRYQNDCSQFLFDENYPLATAACGAAVATAERLEPGPQLEGSLNDLAMAYLHQQRYGPAEELLKRILGMRVTTLGQDHIMTAGTLALLEAVYRKTGRNEAARKTDEEVRRITGNCQGQLSEEQKDEINSVTAPDPCTPETIPPFLR
jgi:tetratricopeptide (TPR) repeat protein